MLQKIFVVRLHLRESEVPMHSAARPRDGDFYAKDERINDKANAETVPIFARCVATHRKTI
jgi:hypothetical protein